MKKFLMSVLLVVGLAGFGACDEKIVGSTNQLQIVKSLDEVSFTIKAGAGQGSGVLVTRNGTHYILSAAHVVESCRHKGARETEKGSEEFVYFDTISVVKEIYDNENLVGYSEYFADVVKYSDADLGEDICILKLQKKNIFTASTSFYLDDKTPPAGTPVYHCGSRLGIIGANSITYGILSHIGRLPKGLNNYFDENSSPATNGSSGCGIFLTDGRYVAMLVRGHSEVQTLVVPLRRIKSYLKSINMEWLINPALPAPKE